MTEQIEQLERIKTIVADGTGVTIPEMESASRKRELIIARQRYCYLSRMHTPHSLKLIGHHLGGRDHSTVMHTLKEINKRIEVDPAEYVELQILETKIVNGKICSLDECIKNAEKEIVSVEGNISEIIRKAWFEGFEEGKKLVPPPIVREKVIFKKIYIHDEDEPKRKPFVRAKADHTNPRYNYEC
jgi:hypothetical protein